MEDLPGAATAGEHLDLVGDAGAGGVDEPDHRHAGAVGLLYRADDLLDRAGSPRSSLHRRVVGHQADRPAIDGRRTGDHAVRRQVAGEHVGVDAVLDERPLVDEQPDPLAGEQLALLGVRVVVLGCTAGSDAVMQVGEVRMPRRILGRVGRV